MSAAAARPTVCMFVRNLFLHDARVTREALSLIDAGFSVVVFAVASTERDAGEEWQGPIRVVRITLGTAVSRFVSSLLMVTRIWYRMAMFPRKVRSLFSRMVFELRGDGEPKTYGARPAGSSRRMWMSLMRPVRLIVSSVWPLPTGATRKSYSERYQGRPPATVKALAEARHRFRDFIWPLHRFLQTVKFGRIAGRMAADLKPVAYHCHDLNSAWAGYRARRWWDAPVVYDSHELWPHRNRADARRRKTWVLERVDRFFARKARAVVTVNESIARHMEDRYRIPEVVVLRNTPLLSAGRPDEGIAPLHLPPPRLIYAGGIQTHRGIEELIQAMPSIPQGTLVLIGPGNERYRESLEKLAETHGVHERVRFTGLVKQEALVATIAQGDVGFALIKNYCLSYYLSLPNKFFEYLHAGLPVIASDFPEMRRLVDRYEVGVTCDPADPAAIAKAVTDLLGRPDDMERMRKNAQRAAAEVNWESESKHLLNLYRRLVPPVDPSDA